MEIQKIYNNRSNFQKLFLNKVGSEILNNFPKVKGRSCLSPPLNDIWDLLPLSLGLVPNKAASFPRTWDMF